MIQLRYKNLLIDQLENGLPEAVATIVESIGDLYCVENWSSFMIYTTPL